MKSLGPWVRALVLTSGLLVTTPHPPPLPCSVPQFPHMCHQGIRPSYLFPSHFRTKDPPGFGWSLLRAEFGNPRFLGVSPATFLCGTTSERLCPCVSVCGCCIQKRGGGGAGQAQGSHGRRAAAPFLLRPLQPSCRAHMVPLWPGVLEGTLPGPMRSWSHAQAHQSPSSSSLPRAPQVHQRTQGPDWCVRGRGLLCVSGHG